MDLVKLYGCLCDRTRLRVLNLLLQGPLCVCHFQEALREPQVKISKHLGYLKRNGLVEAERCGSWMIYRLPKQPDAALRANLACLQDCLRDDPKFSADLGRWKRLRADIGPDCPAGVRRPVTKRVDRPGPATVRRQSSRLHYPTTPSTRRVP